MGAKAMLYQGARDGQRGGNRALKRLRNWSYLRSARNNLWFIFCICAIRETFVGRGRVQRPTCYHQDKNNARKVALTARLQPAPANCRESAGSQAWRSSAQRRSRDGLAPRSWTGLFPAIHAFRRRPDDGCPASGRASRREVEARSSHNAPKCRRRGIPRPVRGS
jgi:hypothetical protein